jgi:hypothetical protein
MISMSHTIKIWFMINIMIIIWQYKYKYFYIKF